MRLWSILPVVGICLLPLNSSWGEEPNPADIPESRQAPADSPPSQPPVDFQPRQPLGAFQPADIGDKSAGSAEPQPPSVLVPQRDPGPQRPNEGSPPDNQASPSAAPAQAPADFQPRQPLGAIQPTDVGLESARSAESEPPAALAPQPDAGPLRAKEAAPQSDEPQTVAPAQFQAPAPAKTQSDPKTTIVPAENAPSLQTAPSANQPAVPEPQNLAQSLYQQSLTPPATGSISGTAISLQEALGRRSDPARYAEFVKSYWKLSQTLATYHDAVQSGSELGQLPAPRAPYQQALLQAARAVAEADLRQAKLQAVASQWELLETMSGEVNPPLPQDIPLMTAYKSKYEAVFAGRPAPAGARRLHQSFDASLAVIEGRAAAVVAAENAYGAAADAYTNGQIDIAVALQEHTQLRSARRDFLRSVYEYNAAIADYAWMAAGPNRSPETISSMLVERRRAAAPADAAPANFVVPSSRSSFQSQ